MHYITSVSGRKVIGNITIELVKHIFVFIYNVANVCLCFVAHSENMLHL